MTEHHRRPARPGSHARRLAPLADPDGSLPWAGALMHDGLVAHALDRLAQGPIKDDPYLAALMRVRARVQDRPLPSGRRANLDGFRTSGIVHAVVKNVRALLPEIHAGLPSFDAALLDELDEAADALFSVTSVARTPPEYPDLLLANLQKARAHRTRLAREARFLLASSEIKSVSMHGLGKKLGVSGLALDLVMLSQIFRELWNAGAHHGLVTVDDLVEAERLAEAVMSGLSHRAIEVTPKIAFGRERARIQVYVEERYDELRRALHYARGTRGDANRIAPPLSVGRQRRKTGADDEAPTTASKVEAASG